MLSIACYHVDAFADRPFQGNPAAVCLLDAWLPERQMAAIAAEFNLSETAFVQRDGVRSAIRWFTPSCEVDLCGHATLAAAHVLLRETGVARDRIEFAAGIGPLAVNVTDGGRLELDFPSQAGVPMPVPRVVAEALGATPEEVLLGEDLLCVYSEQSLVHQLKPNFDRLLEVPGRGVIATAPGTDCDFVSRFFGPKVGVPEDPVTGSAHTILTPYWAARLGKTQLSARQISARGGQLWLTDRRERVGIAGQAITVASGTLCIP